MEKGLTCATGGRTSVTVSDEGDEYRIVARTRPSKEARVRMDILNDLVISLTIIRRGNFPFLTRATDMGHVGSSQSSP
jgi:hypothetical protein